jgi:hypothetical protein
MTYPSLKPVTRKEVAQLHDNMMALLQSVNVTDKPYPTEMHAFLGIIQEEQKIYDTVFQELIRQVTVNMSERGELLAAIRKRYADMFVKIPRHVKNLHTELIAQRKLNRRLSEEVVKVKETVGTLIEELNFIKKHDAEITKQAQDAQEKLVSVLTQSDNTDEILEEYHKLYRMQRDRLEEALRLSEQEKKIWIDASTSLAIRIGQEHGVTEVLSLQRHENYRLRSTNNMISQINDVNDLALGNIETKITEWRSRLLQLSQSVVEEDHMNVEVLAAAQREMKMVNKNLTANEPTDKIESDHPLLKVFHVYDVRSVTEYLNKWTESVSNISIRFTSDRDITIQEDVIKIRRETEIWIQAGFELLRRNQKNTYGKDYVPISDLLNRIATDVEEWLVKIERRASGDDGIASQMIGLQNQIEDRYTAYSIRDLDKPLPATERAQLRDCLNSWVEQINTLTSEISLSCKQFRAT